MAPSQRALLRSAAPLFVTAAAAWGAFFAAVNHSAVQEFCDPDLWGALTIERAFYVLSIYDPTSLWVDWGVMVTAMMLPLLVAPLEHIRVRSLPVQRWRSGLCFLTGYAAVWLLAGPPIVTLALAIRLQAVGEWTALAAAAFVALVWQCSPAKQRALNRCHFRPPLYAFSLRAQVDILTFGVRHGLQCLGACWALMLASQCVGSGHLAATAVVGIFIFAERMERPEGPSWKLRAPRKGVRIVVYTLRGALFSLASSARLGACASLRLPDAPMVANIDGLDAKPPN